LQEQGPDLGAHTKAVGNQLSVRPREGCSLLIRRCRIVQGRPAKAFLDTDAERIASHMSGATDREAAARTEAARQALTVA
jgi:hypothetical protein